MPPEYRVSAEEEKAEYDLHENNSEDAGYRKFLGRLANPLLTELDGAQEGLDFGCGPGPTLSKMLESAGHRVDVYDIFYHRDVSVFERRYDFITATEVVEHLVSPGTELSRLWAMLRPGGVLAIMTKLARDADAFARWHYKNDKTHIAFFSEPTFQWLATQWKCRMQLVASDVVFLHKGVA